MKSVTFNAGDVIIAQGEEGNSAFRFENDDGSVNYMASVNKEFGPNLTQSLAKEWEFISFSVYRTVATLKGRLDFYLRLSLVAIQKTYSA